MITCGEATMRLLSRYGVNTVFGIPGVHTLDLCRGMTGGGNAGTIKHIQTRNEQGAGFMAEGWARATGDVGVAVVISGPGVTNTATALGQCYADSLPMLLISAEPDSRSIGKGWGVLHEITEQKQVTAPLTAFSATAYKASDVPDLMARAFSIFASERPRPCHISIPIDVQNEQVEDQWDTVFLPSRPSFRPEQVAEAAQILTKAKTPVIMVGGGASKASHDIRQICERLGAIVVSSSAGKGIVDDSHDLSLSASTVRPETHRFLEQVDVILAVGTELSETDSFVERYNFNPDTKIIRVDIDASKISDFYHASLGIVSDAAPAMAALNKALSGHKETIGAAARDKVKALRAEIMGDLTPSEKRHCRLLKVLRDSVPPNTIFSGDACQIVYTGGFAMPVSAPRQWFYPAGYCALGNALPNAIGAKVACPDRPVVVLVGDGGFMFTMPELMTATELGLNLPVIIWENGGLKQIQDDMDNRDISRVGVEGKNPDFPALAVACGCYAAKPSDAEAFSQAITKALNADKPTVINVTEGEGWLA